MTTETTLTREDTGTHAVVRVIDAGVHVSAPYSRAVGILDKWVRAERKAADELAAWIEGQTAQAAAEMRQLCDELDLPPAPVKWADPLPPVLAGIRARYGPIDGHSPFDPSPAPDEAMPGRAVVLAPRDNPLAAAYAKAELARKKQGWTPTCDFTIPGFFDAALTCTEPPGHEMPHRTYDGAEIWPREQAPALESSVEGTYTRPSGGVDWRAEWAAFVHDLGRPLRSLRAWWRERGQP